MSDYEPTPQQLREARGLLPFFTRPKEYQAAMDGDGAVLQFRDGAWHRTDRPRSRERYTGLEVAKMLCPDLAEAFDVIEAEA